MNRLDLINGAITINTVSDCWSGIKMAPPDAILGTVQAFKADKSKDKMNLGVGAYRDEQLKPYPFAIVKKVEAEVVADKSLDMEYLPIDGYAPFVSAARNLILGNDSDAVKQGKVASSQSLSGTGALRVGFDFLKKFNPGLDVYMSNPTWGNHGAIIKDAGLAGKTYRYYDAKTRGLDFQGMMHDISKIPKGSIILLHPCAHNPTGVDPNEKQWRQCASLIKQKELFPFLDCAYQGYASGDLEKDRVAIKIFLEMGVNLIVTQSFAKNMGMYGHRTGAIHLVCQSKDVADKVLSQLKLVIRPMYSNPPRHGAVVAAKILNTPQYLAEWKAEIKSVAERIIKMRVLLKEQLVSQGCPGNWDHIVNQIGMFSYTGLTKQQCEILIDKWHIYLLKNGRISMAGINTKNCEYLAKAIKDAILSTS